MRFIGTCYRAHDPRWSFRPLSGEGAAIRGARFNPKGVPALYLGLSIMTAIKEISQGFAHRLDPTVLCSYDVDCTDIVNLTTEEGRKDATIQLDDMASAWGTALAENKRPASWTIYDKLIAQSAGILVPSFAPGAEAQDINLILWTWGPDLPHKVQVFDPSGRLPRNQLSWD